MRRPPSLLLTGLPTSVVLALLLGCPSKSGGKGVEVPPAAPSQTSAPAPMVTAPAIQPTPVAPVEAPKARRARPRPAQPVPPAKTIAAPPPAASAQLVAPALVPMPVAAAPATAPAAPASAPAPVTAAAPVPTAAPAPPTKAALKADAKAKASYRRLVASYGAQMALVFPTNGGLRLAAGGPSVALGLNTVWNLPKGLRLRPRLDYTVFASETRTSTAPPTLGGSMTLSGTSHWTRLGYGPVVTFKVSDHLEVEARALSSHYGYENQPASTATVGLLWRF